MTLRTLAAVTDAIGVVYGLAFLILPEPLFDLFGLERSDRLGLFRVPARLDRRALSR